MEFTKNMEFFFSKILKEIIFKIFEKLRPNK